MPAKRGGFFGTILKGLSSVFSPIVKGIGSVVGGLFGGAKQKAVQVAHRAIATTKAAAIDAIKTGDIKGAATRAFQVTKADAEKTARAEYERGKREMKAEATRHINAAHARAQQGMQSRFGSMQSHQGWRSHGYGPPSQGYRRQVPSYNSFFGAGFTKKHFKKLEKAAHKHIDKIYNDAHKHTKKATAHIKKNGKSGASEARRMVKTGIHASHKAAGAGFRASLAQIKKELAADIAKKQSKITKVGKKGKGAGVRVGAGVKVGAGISIGAGVRKKKGAGVGALWRVGGFKALKGKKGSGLLSAKKPRIRTTLSVPTIKHRVRPGIIRGTRSRWGKLLSERSQRKSKVPPRRQKLSAAEKSKLKRLQLAAITKEVKLQKKRASGGGKGGFMGRLSKKQREHIMSLAIKEIKGKKRASGGGKCMR